MYDPYFMKGAFLRKEIVKNSSDNEIGIIIERFPILLYIVIKINININKVFLTIK